MQAAAKESIMDGSYAATIVPEGGRIDINDLGSDVKNFKKAMKAQVLKIFMTELEHNEEFGDKYRGYRFEEVVDNIADYIDEDSEAEAGGDEGAPYRDHEDRDYPMPPNRPLRTVDELMQVGGMKDDFYKLLVPRITIYGTKGVNINYAEKDVLMALDVTVSEEAAAKIIERRNDQKLGGFFTDEAAFFSFAQTLGVNTRSIQELKLPLLFDTEFNFRVTSTGIASNVRREITAITFDFANVGERYAEMLKKQDDEANNQNQQNQQNNSNNNSGNSNNTNNGNTDQSNKKTPKSTKGRPAVVYWEEN